ncbi:MAG: AAA family ATPase [Phycisphaerales bacterium]|nr:AAA family ATPase [Phycisphaerales bacterium]
MRPTPAGELAEQHPALRTPIIDGLLRQGEVANIIAPPKCGKSWLALGLALSVATGRAWLGTYRTTSGRVLLIDNELHPETIANRLRLVGEAMGLRPNSYGDKVHVLPLRGRLVDVHGLHVSFDAIEPGAYTLVVLDALYRMLPAGTDENSNSDLAAVYNTIDRHADRLGAAFAVVHHTTKGLQSAKSVTDTGAGAGAISRATDTHLILRPHQEQDAVVLDGAARSWMPIKPMVLRWRFPTWTPDPSMDPTRLKSDRPARGGGVGADSAAQCRDFVARFVGDEPRERTAIIDAAVLAGLSERGADRLLRRAVSAGLIFKADSRGRTPALYRRVKATPE